MNTKEIATRLVDYCRKGQFEAAQKELYAEDTLSVEPYPSPDFKKEVKGLQAIFEKGEKWKGMVQEYHSLTVSDPLVVGNAIAFTLDMDITMKGDKRMSMTELCVYKVKDGKIVSEEFIV